MKTDNGKSKHFVIRNIIPTKLLLNRINLTTRKLIISMTSPVVKGVRTVPMTDERLKINLPLGKSMHREIISVHIMQVTDAAT